MTNNLELKKTLWQAADKLRNNMDAAKYKHVVLGLIFLKYISDAFEELYEQLKATENETDADPEDKDENIVERVFYVPPSARWKWLQGRAKLPTIGQDIAGFCKYANIEDVRKNNDILTLGRYIDFAAVAEDGIAFDEKMVSLTLLLKQQMQKANELDEAIKLNLKK